MDSLRSIPFVALLLIAASSGVVSAQPLRERREKLLSFEMPIQTLAAPRPLSSAMISVPAAPAGSSTIRLHLRVVNPGTPGWTVVVEGAGGHSERVTAANFLNNEYWTDDVPGGQATVSVVGGGSVRIEVDSYALQTTVAAPQAIVGNDDSLPIGANGVPPRVLPWARSIARLRFMTPQGGAVCTGFLVGADLFMTNQHCISTASEAASARVEFGFDGPGATPTTFRVTRIEAVDARLDYSLLRLATSASQFGRLYAGPAVVSQMSLAVVQHPQGLPKKVAFPPNCAVGSTSVAGVDNVLNDFGHVCDTLGGSSGSPVLDFSTGDIVGLHHWRWPAGAAVAENQGVHWTLIVKDLEARVQRGALQRAVLTEVTAQRP